MDLFPAAVGQELEVEALVAVLLGGVDVVGGGAGLFSPDVGEGGVDADGGLLVGGVVGPGGEYDADVVLAIDVREGAVAVAHLSCHGAGQAEAYFGAGLYAMLAQGAVDVGGEGLDAGAGRVHVLVHPAADLVVVAWLAEAEGEVLELGLDVVQAEADGQGGVEVVGLAGYLELLVGALCLEGSHVVETVGELDEQCADVAVDALQDLAEVVDLLALVVAGLGALGDDIDEAGDVGAEALPDV